MSYSYVTNFSQQVFRRRQADLERLSPDEIEASRNELADLERQFLERVAQMNRIKVTGANNTKGINFLFSP
jgi:hypothetical protein